MTEKTKNVVEIKEAKDVKEITQLVLSFANDILKKKAETVIAVTKGKEGWKVIVEVLERKAIPDTQDILGRYEFELNPKGKLLNYKQILLRHRSEVKIEE